MGKTLDKEIGSICNQILEEDLTQQVYNVGMSVDKFRKSGDYKGIAEDEFWKRLSERIGSKAGGH